MKKLLVLVVMGLLVVSSVMAYDVSTERVLNSVYNSASGSLLVGSSRGTMVTHRSAVSSADATNPIIGSGVDCNGYKYALVDFSSVAGTQWTVTPIYGNATASKYMAGSSTVVSGDAKLLVDVYSSRDFYVRLDSVTDGGSGHTVTVYVTPVN